VGSSDYLLAKCNVRSRLWPTNSAATSSNDSARKRTLAEVTGGFGVSKLDNLRHVRMLEERQGGDRVVDGRTHRLSLQPRRSPGHRAGWKPA